MSGLKQVHTIREITCNAEDHGCQRNRSRHRQRGVAKCRGCSHARIYEPLAYGRRGWRYYT